MRVCSIDSQHELWKRRGLRPLGKRRRRFPLSHSSGDYWGRLKLYYHACGSWGQVMSMQVLWPIPGNVLSNENDNSVVLALTLGNVSFVLTGDAEADGV